MGAKPDLDRVPTYKIALTVLLAVLGPVVILVTILAIGIVGLFHSFDGFTFGFGETGMPDLRGERLDPVSVDREACPYLAPIRTQAAELDRFWGESGLGSRTGSRGELAVRLAAFESALVAAEPHVPLRIRGELEDVVRNVQVGRIRTVASPDQSFLLNDELFRGLRSLFRVSDLVGTACGTPIYDQVRLSTP